MNNRITKFLAITLFLLNISLVAKGEAVDVVTGATPVKLKIEANADKQLVLDVSYEENSVIRKAPLGLNVDHRLLGKDAQQLRKGRTIPWSMSSNKSMVAVSFWMPGYFLTGLPCVTAFRQMDLYVFMGKRPHLSFHRKLKPGMPVALSNMAGYKNIRNGRPII